MATTFYGNLVNYLVQPSENDHYGSGYGGAGAGRIPQELTFLPLLKGITGNTGFVQTGFAVPSSGTLVAGVIAGTVTAGSAVINGARIIGTSALTVNLSISATNWLFLKLELDGNGKILRPVIHVDTGTDMPAVPSNAITLGKCVCNTTSITGTQDLRFMNRYVFGYIDDSGGSIEYGHRGAGDWTVFNNSGTLEITFIPAFLQAPMALVVVNGTVYYPTSTASMISWSRGSNNKHVFIAVG